MIFRRISMQNSMQHTSSRRAAFSATLIGLAITSLGGLPFERIDLSLDLGHDVVDTQQIGVGRLEL